MKANQPYSKLLYTGLIAALIAPFLFALIAVAQATTTGTVNRDANLRVGPGINYAIVGKATAGQAVTIIGRNSAGSWYELDGGQWIAASLVNTGDNPLAATPTVTMLALQPLIQATLLAQAITDATAQRDANLRAGPGTNYAVIGRVRKGQPLEITGKNTDGSWLQLANKAWIATFLVHQPSIAPPLTAFSKTTATPTPATSGNDFILIEKRLWDPYENGGQCARRQRQPAQWSSGTSAVWGTRNAAYRRARQGRWRG
jgi:N-acetylmuramoyl-L-alanine amidase